MDIIGFIKEWPILSLFVVFFLIGMIPSRSVAKQHKINRRNEDDYNKRIDDHRRNSGQR